MLTIERLHVDALDPAFFPQGSYAVGHAGASTGGDDGGRFAGRDELKDEGGGCLVQPVSVVDDQNQVPVAGAVQNGPPHGLQQIERPGGVIRAAVGGCSGAGTAADRVHQGPEGGEGDARTRGGGDEPLGVNLIGRPGSHIDEQGAGQCGLPHAGGSHQQRPAAVVETREGRGRAAHHGRPGSPSRLPPAPSDQYRTVGPWHGSGGTRTWPVPGPRPDDPPGRRRYAAAMADKITLAGDGTLSVSDQPIIPFIEGDGTGVDIWPAAKLVLDAAAAKYGKSIAWKEVLAGEKAFRETGDWLPARDHRRLQ